MAKEDWCLIPVNPFKLVTDIFLSEKMEWDLNIPIDQARRVLAKANTPRKGIRLIIPPPDGLISHGDHFRIAFLSSYSPLKSQNTSVRYLYGRLHSDQGRVRLEARFRLSIPKFGVTFVFLSGLTFVAGFIAKSLLGEPGSFHHKLMVLMLCIGAPFIAILVLQLSLRFAKSTEERELVKLISIFGGHMTVRLPSGGGNDV